MEQMEQASVPMECQEQIVDQTDESQEIRVICVPFATVHECPKLIDFDQSKNMKTSL